jgi:hypothetical protein
MRRVGWGGREHRTAGPACDPVAQSLAHLSTLFLSGRRHLPHRRPLAALAPLTPHIPPAPRVVPIQPHTSLGRGFRTHTTPNLPLSPIPPLRRCPHVQKLRMRVHTCRNMHARKSTDAHTWTHARAQPNSHANVHACIRARVVHVFLCLIACVCTCMLCVDRRRQFAWALKRASRDARLSLASESKVKSPRSAAWRCKTAGAGRSTRHESGACT